LTDNIYVLVLNVFFTLFLLTSYKNHFNQKSKQIITTQHPPSSRDGSVI